MIKINKFLTKTICVIMSVLLVLGFCSTSVFASEKKAFADDVSTDEGTTTDSAASSNSTITYNNYKDRNNVHFNDIDNGATENRTSTENTELIYMAAVQHDIDPWISLAYNVWGLSPDDNNDGQNTIYDDYPHNGWDEDFGERGYLIHRLKDSQNGDYSKGSGLSHATSLSGAGSNLFSMIEDVIGKHGVKADGYKDAVKLDGLDDDTDRDVIYTNAVKCYREGGTFKYHYNAFGLAFYDFKVNLLSPEDSTNTSGATEYTTRDTQADDGFVSTTDSGSYSTVASNKDKNVSEQKIVLGDTYTASALTETSFEKETKYGQDIGVESYVGWAKDYSLRQTEKESYTKIHRILPEELRGDDIILENVTHPDVDLGPILDAYVVASPVTISNIYITDYSALPTDYKVHCDFSFNESYKQGFKEDNVESTTSASGTETKVIVPAHTAVRTYSTNATDTFQTTCDTPVAITYKVKMYSCNGEVYDDGAACHYTNTAGYDANSMSISFGDHEGSATYGDANYDLYVRSNYKNLVNNSIGNAVSYDGEYGNLKTYSRYNSNNCIKGINWNKVLNDNIIPNMKDWTSKSACDYLCYNYPYTLDGARLNYSICSTYTENPVAVPLWPIGKIQHDYKEAEATLKAGDKFRLDTINLTAYDKPQGEDSGTVSVPYYGFDKSNGYWAIIDSDGKKIDSCDIAEITTDPTTHEVNLVAKDSGTIYVKYFVNEEDNAETGAYRYVTEDGTVSKNENIDSQGIKINITKEDLTNDVAKINVDGSATTIVGKENNLNTIDGLTTTIYNRQDKKIDVVPSWEAQELKSKGITVQQDGTILTDKAGTFHVRAFVNDAYSDWVEIVSQEGLQEASLESSQTTDSTDSGATASNDAQSADPTVVPAATPEQAQALSTDRIKQINNIKENDLFAVFLDVYEKGANSYNVAHPSYAGVTPNISNVGSSSSGVLNVTVNGKQMTITQDSAIEKMKSAGVNVDEMYSMVLLYDLLKNKGQISSDQINHVEYVLNALFTLPQRNQIKAEAYTYGKSIGVIQ